MVCLPYQKLHRCSCACGWGTAIEDLSDFLGCLDRVVFSGAVIWSWCLPLRPPSFDILSFRIVSFYGVIRVKFWLSWVEVLELSLCNSVTLCDVSGALWMYWSGQLSLWILLF